MATLNEKLLGVVVAALIVILVVSVLVASQRISNVGKIKGIGVGIYTDSLCTVKCTQINWGTLGPGEMTGATLWFRNEKNTNFTLSYVTGNWTPASASNYLLLGWNYTGYVFKPLDVNPILVTLTAALNVSLGNFTDFSFDTTVFATESNSTVTP